MSSSDLLEREAEFQLQEDWWAGKAHFVQEFGLVDAMVNGDEVVAICGWRFVPTRDPAGLRICKRCLAIQRNDKR